MRDDELTGDYAVKMQGEIDVQRVADPRRTAPPPRRPGPPQIELDHIERLLKDY